MCVIYPLKDCLYSVIVLLFVFKNVLSLGNNSHNEWCFYICVYLSTCYSLAKHKVISFLLALKCFCEVLLIYQVQKPQNHLGHC